MNIKFIYQSDDKNIEREETCIKVCEYVSTILDIPNNIEIVFAIMHESLYGNTMVNPRFKNRININNQLTTDNMPQVLVHELLHLNQIKTGKLGVTSNGRYIWNGCQITVDPNINYDTLPWEKDVVSKQTPILNKTLEHLNSSNSTN